MQNNIKTFKLWTNLKIDPIPSKSTKDISEDAKIIVNLNKSQNEKENKSFCLDLEKLKEELINTKKSYDLDSKCDIKKNDYEIISKSTDIKKEMMRLFSIRS